MPYEDCPECGARKHLLNKCSQCGFTRASMNQVAWPTGTANPASSQQKPSTPETPNGISELRLSASELEALRPGTAWSDFVRTQVNAYWTAPHRVSELNRVLLAAYYLKRYREVEPILEKIAFHRVSLTTGLFDERTKNDSRQTYLKKRWPQILTRELNRLKRYLEKSQRASAIAQALLSPDQAARPTAAQKIGKYNSAASPDSKSNTRKQPKQTARPWDTPPSQNPLHPNPQSEKVLELIPTMPMPKLVKLWQNCIGYLADEQYKSRWDLSRRVIDAINLEWERRQIELPLDDDYFEWPDITAFDGDGSITGGWLKEGLLVFMGYHVGNTRGVSTNKRHRILTEVFNGAVPPVFPRSYVESWSTAASSHRLKKMAETLASFVRNAKRRRDSRFETAIDQWTIDLEYLYAEYYVGKFHFSWPRTRD